MIDIFIIQDGKLKKIELSELNSIHYDYLWIDIVNPKVKELEEIGALLNIHPLTIEDFLKTGLRVKVEDFENYIAIVLYTLLPEKKIQFAEVDFAIGKKFLISNRHVQIEDIEKFKGDAENLKRIFVHGNDFLLHHLIDIMIDDYFPVLEIVDVKIGKMEVNMFKNPDPNTVNELFKLKRDVLAIKKIATPQKEKLSQFEKRDSIFISKRARPYFRDLYDDITHVAESIDNYRDIITGALEAYLTVVSNKTNEIMKVLTIIATIMMPLTLITGLYGMNVRIPEAQYEYVYFVIIGVMILLSISMIFYFRRKGWI